MSRSALSAGVRHLRDVLAAQQRCGDSDEQLLHAFAVHRDEEAFAVLVHRHGPMVLRVCRRILGHEQDAEDVFQATFLVLAQKAASLRKKTALASFLHGIACRLALAAKRSAARRHKHESSLEARTQPRLPASPADELPWREVRALLDEEIARLPEIYRSVFVLCCLEDVGREEAARRLGVKPGTVASRLAEARKRLARRLARRGVELTAVLAATTVAEGTVSALPAGLMASTLKAVLATATGEKLAGVVSVSVAELVEGAMRVSKAKIATVILLTASLLTGASVSAYRGLAANPLTPPIRPQPRRTTSQMRLPPSRRRRRRRFGAAFSIRMASPSQMPAFIGRESRKLLPERKITWSGWSVAAATTKDVFASRWRSAKIFVTPPANSLLRQAATA
jgi:RNA polymerase sigma factor (sigma-70 family)